MQGPVCLTCRSEQVQNLKQQKKHTIFLCQYCHRIVHINDQQISFYFHTLFILSGQELG